MEDIDSHAVPPSSGAENRATLIERLLFAIGFGIVAYLALLLLFALAVAQFVVALIDQAPNAELKSFTRRLVRYLAETAAYVSLSSDVRPFPFAPFPVDMDA